MVNSQIKHLVLDVLRPHEPPLPEFTSILRELKGVTRVEITLIEMDERTESLKIVLDGTAINYEELKEHIGKQSAVIHSVDQVVVEKIVKH